MKKIRIILALLLILSVFPAVQAQNYRKPGPRDMVLVAKFIMTPAVDDAFYSQYWGMRGLSVRFTRPAPGVNASTATLWMDGLGFLSGGIFGLGDVGTFSTTSFPLPKDRSLRSRGLSVYLGAHSAFEVAVPLAFQTTIPEGVQYLYLGTFEISWSGLQYEITELRRIDEFEEAQKVVAERYGPGARLERAVLSAPTQD